MFAIHVQRRAARYEDLKIGRGGQKFRNRRRRLHQVLEIIQQQQHRRAR